MIQAYEFPVLKEYITPFVDWDKLNEKLKELGVDGLDGAWIPTQRDSSMPREMLIGSHLFTMPDWMDFWDDENESELLRRCGTMEKAKAYYGGGPDQISMNYLLSAFDAIQCGVHYISWDVFNVTYEESQSYKWKHDDYAVMDDMLLMINAILEETEPTFDFLVENSWWPGFTFTDPEKTEYLLSRINYPRVGIMLNTGRLMNTNPDIRTEKEGAEYIRSMLQAHGELAKSILGVRLSKSISGEYVQRSLRLTESLYSGQEMGTLSFAFANSLLHDFIRAVDEKLPWTAPEVNQVLEDIAPEYLVHGLRYLPDPELAELRQQVSTLKKR